MSHKPITIVHLITELNMGGAEQMLHKLVSKMDPRKFRSIVISMTDRGPVGEKIASDGIPVLELGMTLGRPNLKGFYRIFYYLHREQADILQTWLYHADLLGLVAGRLAGIKRIVWGLRCSNMHLRNYRPLTALTVKAGTLLSPLADAIVVNSRKGRDVHRRRGYHTDRMIFIPNGFDVNRFHPDESAKKWLTNHLGIPEDVVLVGLVARFDPMKDQPTFLNAASLILKKHDSVHFVLIGKDIVPTNKVLTPFINDHLRSRVHLLGVRRDIPRLTAAFDIGNSSSAFGEGFSNTIGEAMACGVPCVVTNVGDSSFVVGDTGFVVPPKEPETLAKAWEEMLKQGRDSRKAMGEKARERITENFELGKIVKRFEHLYKKLAEKRG